MDTTIKMPHRSRSALVVVDMQNGFIHERGSCAKAGFPIGALSSAVAPCAELIVSARRAAVPVVYTRYTYRADFRDGGFMLKEKFPMLADANALVAGTWDQAIVDELAQQSDDFVIDKNRPSAFHGTPLDSYLKGLGVEDVVVCGVTTNCCVETTVRDAAQRDYRTFVVTDAVAEWEEDRHQAALKTMALLFAHPLTVAQVVADWR
jgi:ureidoacrylate peracid hydrolase